MDNKIDRYIQDIQDRYKIISITASQPTLDKISNKSGIRLEPTPGYHLIIKYKIDDITTRILSVNLKDL